MKPTEPFAARVAALHQTWTTRRELIQRVQKKDVDPGMELLLAIYEWSERAAQTIEAVYEGALAVRVSPTPVAQDEPPAFTVTVDDRFRLRFSLGHPGSRQSGDEHVEVQVRTPSAQSLARMDPVRQSWSRQTVEDLLLSLLASYERAQ